MLWVRNDIGLHFFFLSTRSLSVCFSTDRVHIVDSITCYHIDYVLQDFSHILVTDYYAPSALSFGESGELYTPAGV